MWNFCLFYSNFPPACLECLKFYDEFRKLKVKADGDVVSFAGYLAEILIMAPLKRSQGVSKVITVHPGGNMNVYQISSQ